MTNDQRNKLEGWALFNEGVIQRLDDPSAALDPGPVEPFFSSDLAAIRWVKGRAATGSARHQRALALHNRNTKQGEPR